MSTIVSPASNEVDSNAQGIQLDIDLPIIENSHPMVTRSKNGIMKPKVY